MFCCPCAWVQRVTDIKHAVKCYAAENADRKTCRENSMNRIKRAGVIDGFSHSGQEGNYVKLQAWPMLSHASANPHKIDINLHLSPTLVHNC